VTQQPTTTRDFWSVFAALGAVVALVFGLVALAAGGDGTEVQAAGGTKSTTVDVTLGDLFIEPAALEVPAGEVILNVTNTGSSQHDLHLDGTDFTTPMLGKGDTERLELGVLEPGTYALSCHVPGHKQAAWKRC
jgi:uncharacterized cupredoxin-like copper-binding protein